MISPSFSTFSILIVDDNPDNFDVITTVLDADNCQFHYSDSGRKALERLDVLRPDLILLDVMMPDMDGLELCKRLRRTPQWQTVPIIVVTALSSAEDLAECLAAGANDFVSKPLNSPELRARVNSMLRIREQYLQLESFNARLEAEVQKRTRELEDMVFRDALTKLYSRVGLISEISHRLQCGQADLAVVYLDCDDFNLVNTSLGHGVGNRLLKAIANRLQQYLGRGDVLSRTGEDEFCFLLSPAETTAPVETFVQQVLHSLERSFLVDGYEVFVTACAGIAFSQNGNSDPEVILQNADTAMYQAKLKGRNSYQIFDRAIQLKVANRLALENDLQKALEQKEFINHYQPIIDLRTRQLVAVEALVRWQHPQRGMVAPGEFIPSLEATGLIVPVGLLVLEQACRQLHQWHQQGWQHLNVSVNLAARQFACPTLLTDIDRILAETQLNPAHLKLEITESAIMENAESAIALTQALRSRQIQISIDDFGTGYSSLGYLHRFPLNTLKIDRSFVSGDDHDSTEAQTRNRPVVEAIIALSQQLGLSVVAEGIETFSQLQWLQSLGCQYGQGYYFSPPLSIEDMAARYLAQP